jgi:DNA-binding transcriptional ArsR family regulator
MNEEKQIESLAEVFQALSDPNRLRILEILLSVPHPICVTGIANRLGISQSAVSQHLKVLKNNGLVTHRKESYFKHYSLNEERFREVRRMRATVLGNKLEL